MTQPRAAQGGFTLIEMMVSLIIMTIVIGGVLRMAGTLTNAYQDSRRTAVAERNARAVLDIITDTIRNASPGVPRSDLQDLVGCSGTGGLKVTNSSTGPDQLDVIHAIGGVVTSLRAPFTASDSSLTVLDGSELRAGDYIIVTNLDKGHILEVSDVQPSGSEYVVTLTGSPSSLCSGVVFPTGDYAAGDLVLRAQVSRFYVDSSAAVDYLPTMMVDPDGDGPAAAEPLAGGIEDFQVAVGVDIDGDGSLADTGEHGRRVVLQRRRRRRAAAHHHHTAARAAHHRGRPHVHRAEHAGHQPTTRGRRPRRRLDPGSVPPPRAVGHGRDPQPGGLAVTRRPPMRQRGSVMVLVLIILVALLAGAAVVLNLQMSSTKQVGLVSQARASLFCAEAGLSQGKTIMGANYALWNDILDTDTSNDPSWYPIRGDIDDPPDGIADYEVTVKDNDDELPPAANDTTRDNDLKIFIVSKCLKYPETPREVLELVVYNMGNQVYRNQSGQGSGNTGNAN